MRAQHEQKEMVIDEREQNWGGRKNENADFVKEIQNKPLLHNHCSKQE